MDYTHLRYLTILQTYGITPSLALIATFPVLSIWFMWKTADFASEVAQD